MQLSHITPSDIRMLASGVLFSVDSTSRAAPAISQSSPMTTFVSSRVLLMLTLLPMVVQVAFVEFTSRSVISFRFSHTAVSAPRLPAMRAAICEVSPL